jgi:hypothetical protein
MEPGPLMGDEVSLLQLFDVSADGANGRTHVFGEFVAGHPPTVEGLAPASTQQAVEQPCRPRQAGVRQDCLGHDGVATVDLRIGDAVEIIRQRLYPGGYPVESKRTSFRGWFPSGRGNRGLVGVASVGTGASSLSSEIPLRAGARAEPTPSLHPNQTGGACQPREMEEDLPAVA